MLAAAFRMTQTAVIGLNLLNMFQAVRSSTTPSTGASGSARPTRSRCCIWTPTSTATSSAWAFFGVSSTVIVGYLAPSSRRMPRPLGAPFSPAPATSSTPSAFFLIPGYDGSASPIVLAPALVAEIWFALWLLAKGR
ncbi:MAG: DUF4386 domain-containing protein [Ilumatobacteraceae bacterium]